MITLFSLFVPFISNKYDHQNFYRKLKVSVFCFLCGTLIIVDVVPAYDYTTLYSQPFLEKVSDFYAPRLSQQFNLLKSTLKDSEKQQAANIVIKTPLAGINRTPFDYYSNLRRREITIPILSVQFYRDLIFSLLWKNSISCSPSLVFRYVSMIRHHNPLSLPGGRFPQPFEALGVPDNVVKNPDFVRVVSQCVTFTTYFIIAHEIAHILNNDSAYGTISAKEAQQQEKNADTFALELMRRNDIPPIGVESFFWALSRFELTPNDFPTFKQYQDYLRQTATHPLSDDRLMALAQAIRNNIDNFCSQLNDSGRESLLQTASSIEQIIKFHKDLDLKYMGDMYKIQSLNTSFEKLPTLCHELFQ